VEFEKVIIPIEEINKIKENTWLKLITGDFAMYRNIDKNTGAAEVCYWNTSSIGFGPHHSLSYGFNYATLTEIEKAKKENNL
jgi:hypothetical protein